MEHDYDRLAGSYDQHFQRPVDQWEDERLARLLHPHVDGRWVLDLGCGTGWVLDHLDPAAYVGVDRSAAMLAELAAKHPGAKTVKAEIGAEGSRAGLLSHTPDVPYHGFDAITATWALQYLGDLHSLLPELAYMLAPGGVIAMHGYLPRYFSRGHEITWGLSPLGGPPCLTAGQVRVATRPSGLRRPRIAGTGALPDRLARSRLAWRLALAVPARWHYAALWTWRL